MFELVDHAPQSAVIKVIGVGGGGGNAVQHMLTSEIEGVDFICANTDAQALKKLTDAQVLHIGHKLTKGLGAGANPNVGREAAIADRERIADMLDGADMVFITAGMGGGTGTGAAPIVADIAKELGILTVAVVTKPFPFEGRRRMNVACEGIKALAESVDSLITVPNEKLLEVMGPSAKLTDAFKESNKVLQGAVQGIAELIIRDGMINVDFADVKTVMSEMGMAMMGTGFATGENRARQATEAAIRCPLLEDIDLQGAKGILVNITAGLDLSLGEFTEVGDTIEEFASDNATVVVGTVIDPEMTDELRVTVVATGLGDRVVQSMQVVNNPLVRHKDGSLDFDAMDVPAIVRRRQGAAKRRASAPKDTPVENQSVCEPISPQATVSDLDSVAMTVRSVACDDEGLLDIPTFLRRQAD